ncbi:uncharacterized protein LOC129723746 [Wyeomyia smithii]|uniref:uncharacterized protein LOC129723746 n=1 Tax=Wyeomyia smithii TaxID=174621 RepID=UPI002467D8F7|nr:uncharacterized protein LOC129723746 [Wyeomyia smithii]
MTFHMGRSCPSETVSIKEQITQYQRKHNKNPIIIIDLMYFDQLGGYLHRNNTAGKMRDLCGISRLRIKELEEFVAKLKKFGAELIFITNGAYMDISGQTVPDEDDSKNSSKDWRYVLQMNIIDRLGLAHYSHVASDAKFIPIERVWTESICKIARKSGKVLWAWDNSRHQEIAKYACVHQAMAIISKNFVLLLYSGIEFPKYKLWSMADCSTTNMEIAEFDPLVVRRTLRLSSKQTRVLAALYGWYNESPTFYDFLERIKVLNCPQTLFRDITAYVKKTAANLQEMDYLKIARDLFGEQKYIDKFADFKAVCNGYNIDSIVLSSEQNNDSVSVQLKRQDSFNYDIYHGIAFTCSITFVDYRYWQDHGIDLYEIFVSFYERVCGVVLQHKKDRSLVRHVNVKRNHMEPYQTVELKPEYPTDLIIPSLDYMFSLAGQALIVIPDFNVCLLEFVIGMQLDRIALGFFIRTDQRSYFQDSVTLAFMVSLHMIDRIEADIFLIAIHKCRCDSEDEVPLPENLHLRALHLYFTYVKMRTLIKHSFYCAGLDDSFMDESYLDGAVFQNMFQKYSVEGSTAEFNKDVSKITRYRLH